MCGKQSLVVRDGAGEYGNDSFKLHIFLFHSLYLFSKWKNDIKLHETDVRNWVAAAVSNVLH